MRITTFFALATLLVGSALSQLPPPPLQTMEVCLGKVKAMYQGNCISDWAVVPVTAVELVWCLTGAAFDGFRLSPQDLICNCQECHTVRGNGCMGGNLFQALKRIENGQAVAGDFKGIPLNEKKYTDYGFAPKNYVDCLTYWSDPCDPTEASCKYEMYDPMMIPSTAANTYCPLKCNRPLLTEKLVSDAKVTGAMVPSRILNSVVGIQDSLKLPKTVVVSSMEIYEDMDFFFDKTAVFRHTTGQSLGISSVIIISYTPAAGQVPAFWTVLVPWDRKHTEGLKGQTIRIIAGVNHGGIESQAYEIKSSN